MLKFIAHTGVSYFRIGFCLIFLFVFSATSTNVMATGCDIKSNHIENCGFDNGLENWELSNPGFGESELVFTPDASNLTALRLGSDETGRMAARNCFKGGKKGTYFASLRSAGGGGSVNEYACAAIFDIFPNTADCSGIEYETVTAIPPNLTFGDLETHTLETSVSVDFQSAEVSFVCASVNSSTPFPFAAFHVDDFYFGRKPPPEFSRTLAECEYVIEEAIIAFDWYESNNSIGAEFDSMSCESTSKGGFNMVLKTDCGTDTSDFNGVLISVDKTENPARCLSERIISDSGECAYNLYGSPDIRFPNSYDLPDNVASKAKSTLKHICDTYTPP